MTWILALLLAISDSTAATMAYERWGAVGSISTTRKWGDSNWTRLVGYASPGCVNLFTMVGSGYNTWDAAYADADLHPAKVNGPYAGMLSIQVGGDDTGGILSMELFIDGASQGIQTPAAPPPRHYEPTWMIDTTHLTTDYHVVCAQGMNVGGLTGKLYTGILFQVNQTIGKLNGAWLPGAEYPGLAATITFNGSPG